MLAAAQASGLLQHIAELLEALVVVVLLQVLTALAMERLMEQLILAVAVVVLDLVALAVPAL